MAIDVELFDKKIEVDTIVIPLENGNNYSLDVLRLDSIHPTISGNKWFKLKYNLLEAERQNANAILSFGGAYSNHLHALAFAGKIFNLKTIGIVRGEKVENPTLTDCKNWGMELHFITRGEYRKKTETDFLKKICCQFQHPFIIPEGGDNALGQKGCSEILPEDVAIKYDILCCSIGTGTTIRGLAKSFKNKIWGFSSFKKADDLKEVLRSKIPQLRYIDDYHFGGFGKINAELEKYLSAFYEKYNLELDRIYTAKMFYGIEQELNNSLHFSEKNMLVIHTGGLQGNRSLE